MKRVLCCSLTWLVCVGIVAGQDARQVHSASTRSSSARSESSIPAGLRCLRAAYPEQVCSITPNLLVMCDGRSFAYSDGRIKSHAERLESPDLQDMLAEPYPPLALGMTPPAPNSDPGRVRHQAFFDAMYGATEREVRARLTRVAWMPGDSGRGLRVSTVNGVDTRLRAVAEALAELPPELRAQAAKTAGTFNHRAVAGTERRSAHSYGIAIDVAPELGDYWRWRERGAEPPLRYRNRMPLEIVAAFEREGFIWGGRWSHYDTMHFEYRPELLVPECREQAPDPQPAARAMRPAPARANEPARSSRAVSARYAWPESEGRAASLLERVSPPPGFQRVALSDGSFAAWLRDLPLEPEQAPVHLYDGQRKAVQGIHAAVLAIDTGRRDLQQCADAVMRLRAEYLFASGRADEVCFRAVSGDAMPYASYQRGLRPPRGRAAPWTAAAEPDASWTGFRTYLDRVFGIANTASLARELEPVADPRQISAGDVYIEGARAGRFGHAVLVLDVAENAAGERVFLIAQSFMPAQDMHVLRNPNEPELGPWFRAPADGSLETPEWSFPRASLRRFAASCHPNDGATTVGTR